MPNLRRVEQSTAVPTSPANVYEVLPRRAATYPSATALGSQQGLTWRSVDSAELLARVDQLAVELAREGVGEGDRVVLWVPNTWRIAAYLFAIWKLGAIVVPFDREMNPDAATTIIEAVEPSAIVVGYGEQPPWADPPDVTEWWEPGSRSEAAPPPAAWRPPDEELAAIFFTSGTTGDPKGCMITHANLRSQIEALGEVIPLDTSSRLASILPLSHLFELVCGLLFPLASGAAVHYIPTRRGPDIVRVLSEQRISHMIAVPQLLTLMGGAFDERLRSSLPGPLYRALNGLAARAPMRLRRWLFFMVHRKIGGRLGTLASGGAALGPETQRQWERLGVRVVQGYGTSECSPVIACGRADGGTPIGSVGGPIRGVEVKLAPDGELLVHGPNVMKGYWKDPVRTAEVLHDGWYATGDLARIDEAGDIWLSGRAKDLIVLPSGMNVWPEDVEDAFREHPAVKDAAVIAVPSAAGGAALHAYLLAAGPQSPIEGIVTASNGRLAQHQRVATAAWWDDEDFPRTAGLQKVRRHLLPIPDRATTVEVDRTQSADDPIGQAIAASARVAAVQPHQTLGELGIDSLALVDLALSLEERSGKAVGDSDLSLEMTVTQVRQFMAGAAEGHGSDRQRAESLISATPSMWPYTWGRAFRFLGFPIDLLYQLIVTRTVIAGSEHLADLPPRVILAGTHHGYPDMPLVRRAVRRTLGRAWARRLVVATAASGLVTAGILAKYGTLSLGLYPLRQYSDRDASLRGLARLAAAGNPILIFPQGAGGTSHPSPDDERAGDHSVRFRPGVAHLATSLDAVVVPFGLAGTEEVLPPSLRKEHRGRSFGGLVPIALKRGPLAIVFGQPLSPGPDEPIQAFTERLQDASFGLTRDAERALKAGPAG